MDYILITGGCGYIGVHLCKLMQKYNIIVYDNLKFGTSYLNKFCKTYKGDISDRIKLERLFEKYKFSTVIHLAGLAHISESTNNPQLYYNNNLIYSKNLLEISIKFKTKYFIFSSSCTVYGDHMLINNPNHIINENDILNPISTYGRTKMMFENILKDYASKYNFNYSILRYFNACGSAPDFEVGEYHKEEKRIIPRIINFSLGKIDELCIFGDDYNTKDGSAIRDYTHVCDIAQSHINALEVLKNEKRNITCNIGSGRGYSIFELIKIVEKISNKKLNVKAKPRRKGDAAFMVCCNKKAKEELNWTPKYNIEDILKTSYEWYKNRLPKIINKIHLHSYHAIEENINGDLYSGEIKDNKLNGKGKLIFSDGGICEGIFENNKFIKGKYTLETGATMMIE